MRKHECAEQKVRRIDSVHEIGVKASVPAITCSVGFAGTQARIKWGVRISSIS